MAAISRWMSARFCAVAPIMLVVWDLMWRIHQSAEDDRVSAATKASPVAEFRRPYDDPYRGLCQQRPDPHGAAQIRCRQLPRSGDLRWRGWLGGLPGQGSELAAGASGAGLVTERRRRIEAVVFDLDGTLADTMTLAPQAYADTIRLLGGPVVSPAQVVAAWHIGPTAAVRCSSRYVGRDTGWGFSPMQRGARPP